LKIIKTLSASEKTEQIEANAISHDSRDQRLSKNQRVKGLRIINHEESPNLITKDSSQTASSLR